MRTSASDRERIEYPVREKPEWRAPAVVGIKKCSWPGAPEQYVTVRVYDPAFDFGIDDVDGEPGYDCDVWFCCGCRGVYDSTYGMWVRVPEVCVKHADADGCFDGGER